VSEITEVFGIESGDQVPVSTLPDISLAVIQQLSGGYCASTTSTTTEQLPAGQPTDFQS